MGSAADKRSPQLDRARIEEAGLNAMQTQRQLFYDGWLLRVSPGVAKRARSVNAHFGSTLPLARKIAHCEDVYAQHALPPLFRMTIWGLSQTGLSLEYASSALGVMICSSVASFRRTGAL